MTFVRISDEVLEDVAFGREVLDAVNEAVARAANDRWLDITIGPRYGPPAPRVEYVEPRCDYCGHVLDDWDDE